MNPEKLRYTEDHEWVGEHDGKVIVGITEYAQEQLGDITYVELPRAGRKVKANEEAAVVESVKAASDVFAPVTGTIIEINEELETEPELVNKDPYGKGWFFKMNNVDKAEVDHLMNAAAYKAFVSDLQ